MNPGTTPPRWQKKRSSHAKKRGSALVEMAYILPVLIMLFVGSTEICLWVLKQSATNAVANGLSGVFYGMTTAEASDKSGDTIRGLMEEAAKLSKPYDAPQMTVRFCEWYNGSMYRNALFNRAGEGKSVSASCNTPNIACNGNALGTGATGDGHGAFVQVSVCSKFEPLITSGMFKIFAKDDGAPRATTSDLTIETTAYIPMTDMNQTKLIREMHDDGGGWQADNGGSNSGGPGSTGSCTPAVTCNAPQVPSASGCACQDPAPTGTCTPAVTCTAPDVVSGDGCSCVPPACNLTCEEGEALDTSRGNCRCVRNNYCNNTCSSGETLNVYSCMCENRPSCPNGTMYNNSGKCGINKNCNPYTDSGCTACPTGTTYVPGACVADATCAAGQRVNPSTNLCTNECAGVNCTSPYYLNFNSCSCELPACTAGTSRGPDGVSCVQDCSSNQIRDTDGVSCKSCDSNQRVCRGSCVAKCTSDQEEVGCGCVAKCDTSKGQCRNNRLVCVSGAADSDGYCLP